MNAPAALAVLALIFLNGVCAAMDTVLGTREPEPLKVEKKYDDYVESWSYEFIPTDESVYINVEDSPGNIVYADGEWILKSVAHPAKTAFKSFFDIYFYSAKTLQLVSAIRAPNLLYEVRIVPSTNLFAILINSQSKPHFCLGSPALLLVDPFSRKMEKFDVPSDGWRDSVLSMRTSNKEIDVAFDPAKAKTPTSGFFKSNVFEGTRIRIAGYTGRDLEARRASDPSSSMKSVGSVDFAGAGLAYLRGSSKNGRAAEASADEGDRRWESMDDEERKKSEAPVSIADVSKEALHGGINCLSSIENGFIRILNLKTLKSHLVKGDLSGLKNLGMKPDGTVHYESRGIVSLLKDGKVSRVPVTDAELLFCGNNLFSVPKARNFGLHEPFSSKICPPPLNLRMPVTEMSTDGETRALRLLPDEIAERFYLGEKSESDARYEYTWHFFPSSAAVAIAESRSFYQPVVSYRIFPQQQNFSPFSLRAHLGLEAAQDIRLEKPSNGWMPISLLTNFYNIGPSYSIVLWNDRLKRCFGVQGDLSGHPGLLHFHWKSEQEAFVLYSRGDITRLVKFDPSLAASIPAKVPDGEYSSPPTLGSEYQLDAKLVQEWISPSVELPALFLKEHGILLVPNLAGYEVYELFRSDSPAKICELYLSGSGSYAILLPNGTYCGSPGVEREIIRRAGSSGNVDASIIATWRNRPAEVLRALKGDPEQIEVLEKVTQRWLNRLQNSGGISEPDADDVPVIELAEEVPLWAQSDRITLRFRARSGSRSSPGGVLGAVGSLLGGAKPSIDRISVRVNGVEQAGAQAAYGSDGEGEWSQEVRLAEGQNWIEASAIDANGLSSNLLRFRVVLAESKKPARRYIIALGVSEYQEAALNLAYAAKDAQNLADTLRGTKGESETLVLLNGDVTKGSLVRIREFLEPAGENDEVIVFCAGHGVLDGNLDYVFASHDFDPERPAETGIKLDDLIDTIGKSKSLKRLLLLDTCHAGQVGEREEILLAQSGSTIPKGVRAVQQRGMSVKPVEGMSAENQQRFIEEMFSLPGLHRGINVIGASGGAEFALESEKWNNGVFTAALIEALRDKQADANSDGRVGVAELRSYLADRVSKLTGGAQKPSVVAFEQDQDFDIIKVSNQKVLRVARDESVNDAGGTAGFGASNIPIPSTNSAEEVIRAFFAGLSNRNEPEVSKLLDDRVDYYRSGKITKTRVMADIKSDWKRWSRGSFQVSDFQSQGDSTLGFVLDYELHDGKRPRSGKLNVTADVAGSPLRIKKLKYKVISAN
jgi:hypothetical protein